VGQKEVSGQPDQADDNSHEPFKIIDVSKVEHDVRHVFSSSCSIATTSACRYRRQDYLVPAIDKTTRPSISPFFIRSKTVLIFSIDILALAVSKGDMNFSLTAQCFLHSHGYSDDGAAHRPGIQSSLQKRWRHQIYRHRIT